MLKPTTALVVGLLIAAFAPAMAATVTEEEAHAIGAEAYLYFYPLVTMEVTREQLTNQESGPGSLGGPMNKFANIPAFPTAEMKAVVRPNFDTLYSSGWLDLTKEPVVVSARTRADATTSCLCSICGAMCSPRLAGAPRELKPKISLSHLPAGRA